MAARAGGDRDQPVGSLFQRLPREAGVDHVVHDDAAIGVDGLVHLRHRAERGDDDRRLVLHAHFDVVHQPVIALVHDLIDGKGRRGPVRMFLVMFGKFGSDPIEPLVQHLGRPGIQRREGPDDAGLALGDHQIRSGDDEHRRGDDGDA